jgi:hypothetical protein
MRSAPPAIRIRRLKITLRSRFSTSPALRPA